jgi:hypothetical protein
VDQIVERPDGSILAFGFGPLGPIVRHSQDGLEWTSIDENTTPIDVRQWGERFLVGLDEPSQEEVLVSENGRVWEPLGLAERFPLRLWGPTAMDAGPAGVAIAIQGWINTTPPELGPPMLELDNGSSLAMDFEDRSFVLEAADITYTFPVRPGDEQEGIDVNLEDRSVSFVDPETDQLLGEVTISELKEAETAFFANTFAIADLRAFVFTPDGSEWTIQDISTEIVSEGRIGMLEVGAEHLLAVVQKPEPYLSLGGQTLVEGPSGFELWSSEIP